jgi:hypothetical protein
VKTIGLADLDLLSIGHEIQLAGAIYSGKGRMFLIPLPDEDGFQWPSPEMLVMSAPEMEAFLRQTDLLEVEGPGKAILRKSQRQIDQALSWRVFERDGYRCRYCGEKRPLTVDHVDLWEKGGVTIERNLLSACRRCNKMRGKTPYREWLKSADYAKVSAALPNAVSCLNISVLSDLDYLKTQRVAKQRSR